MKVSKALLDFFLFTIFFVGLGLIGCGDDADTDHRIQTIHTTGTLEASDGLRLFEQSWQPANKPKAVIVIVHGYAEHSSRYFHVAEHLVKNGYAVNTCDLRRHGQSEGEPRTFIRSFDEYLVDLKDLLALVKERYPGERIYLFGHSMGGTISTYFTITQQSDIDGLLLSGALLKIPDEYPSFLIQLIKTISILFPKLPLLKIDAADVSRDPEVVETYDTDPLVYRGGIPARTATEINSAMEVIQEQMEAIEGPLLIMHGTADRLPDPEGSKQLHARANSNDKTLKLYEGLYHEILNEPEKEQILADVVEWLDGY